MEAEQESAPLAIVPHNPSAVAMEMAIGMGDFSRLTAPDRLQYIGKLCQYVGLNPLTKPIGIITIGGKVVLYANKSCAEQLRGLHHISIKITERVLQDGCYVVRVVGRLPDGREDESVGAVSCPPNAIGDVRANAMMKAETKAKRRVTLSIVGLGFIPDETELETMKPAQVSGVMTAGESAVERGDQLLQLTETLSAEHAGTPEKEPVTGQPITPATPAESVAGSPAGVVAESSAPSRPAAGTAATAPASVPSSAGAAPSILPPETVEKLEAVFLFKDAAETARVAAMTDGDKAANVQRAMCIGYCVSKGWLAKTNSPLSTIPADKAKRIIANPRGLHNAVAAWATPKS